MTLDIVTSQKTSMCIVTALKIFCLAPFNVEPQKEVFGCTLQMNLPLLHVHLTFISQTDFPCPVKSNSSCMKGKILSVQVQGGVFKNVYKSSHQQQHWDLKAE